MSDIKLLVISYYFPPFKRVGGRRWAKHVKYLTRLGVETYVLSGDFPGSVSSWDEDIVEYKNRITRTTLTVQKQPLHKRSLPNSLLSKIFWKVSLYKGKLTDGMKRGNYFDASQYDKEAFLRNAIRLIQEKNINTLILSVGPFRYAEILCDLRKTFPDLRIIIDYRDGWGDNFGMLSQAQQQFEYAVQDRVLNAVSQVVTVYDSIAADMNRLKPGLETFVLPHCVDEDFLGKFKDVQPGNFKKGKIRLVYGGELYGGMEAEVTLFVKFVQYLKQFAEVEAEFYLSYIAYKNILEAEPSIKVHNSVSKEKYIEKIFESDLLLVFRPKWSLNSFSSKLFELVSARKPIVSFGNEGLVSDFLESNRLGFHILPETLEKKSTEIISNLQDNRIPDRNYDLTPFTFEFQTRRLIEFLKKETESNVPAKRLTAVHV